MTALVAGVLALATLSPAEDPPFVAAMERAYARVDRYTARFERQERLRDELRPREEAVLKFARPGQIYLRWLGGPPKGREVLFVKGRDGDRALVHEPGLLSGRFTLVMAPGSRHVLAHSRHAITDIGIGRLIELLTAEARRALGRGELSVSDRGQALEGRRPARRLEMVFAGDPPERYESDRALVSIDAETDLPIRVTLLDRAGALVADYAYLDLTLNPGLTALDFDPENPEYGFPRWRLNLSS